MVVVLRDARNIGLGAVKLLPWRPSRKFQVPQMMEDPALELKAAKAEREARFRASTVEPVMTPATDLAEIKRKRQEEARAAEEKYVLSFRFVIGNQPIEILLKNLHLL